MRHALLLLALLPFYYSCNEQQSSGTKAKATANPADSLRRRLAEYIAPKKADIGVAIASMDNSDTISVHGDRFFPMMSVAKFPQALLLLHLVDEGKVGLAEPLHFNSTDLQQRTGSTFRKDHPGEAVDITIPEALKYSMGQSDNITANKIFDVEGGPAAVDDYVRQSGVDDVIIVTDFGHMGPDSAHNNRATPKALVRLLQKFQQTDMLSDSMKALLWKLMAESSSGPDRLKGQLPAGTVVAHKTGTGSRNDSTGVTEAFNDVGIVELPGGKHFVIAVFIANSREPQAANAEIIAAISRMAWDYFMAQGRN